LARQEAVGDDRDDRAGDSEASTTASAINAG